MGSTAAEISSRFVISVGDNFYEDGVANVSDPQWQTSFERIYTHPALSTPWHVILGNHDYQGNVDAQLAYSARSRRWSLPSPYYTRTETLADGTTVEFFFLDTSRYILEYLHRPKGTRARSGQAGAGRLARARSGAIRRRRGRSSSAITNCIPSPVSTMTTPR